ncbi:cytoskeleton-associated protein 2-like [Diadema antillarum]|uniref:cytoskeleton-associated protein 2-like n=1 Tax=Diadema antillarum TaxID=105358 RepID=UPI003A89CFF6
MNDRDIASVDALTNTARKRRRSSIEHEIMLQKLAEWRTKKGLPVGESFHRTTPLPAKRKSCQLSKSEKKNRPSLQTTARFCTPGPSSHHGRTPSFLGCTRATSQSTRKPSRQSLNPSTLSRDTSATRQHQRGPAGVGRKASQPAVTPAPLVDRTNHILEPSGPYQETEVTFKPKATTQSRKSVRFASPRRKDTTVTVEMPFPVPDALNTPATAECISKVGMRTKLEQWLISKGKTPSRFRNFLGYESSLIMPPSWGKRRRSCTPGPSSRVRGRSSTPARRRSMGAQPKTSDPVSAVMKECLVMLEEGCPLEDLSSWLDGMVTKVPLIHQSASYWVCKAAIAERRNGDQSAAECLCEALEFGAEPVKELRDRLDAYRLKLKLSSEDQDEHGAIEMRASPGETGALSPPMRASPSLQLQTPVAHLDFDDEPHHQSVRSEESPASHLNIKYSLKETTPYFARIRCTPGHNPATPCMMVTPVRRSARLDNKRRSVVSVGLHPAPVQEDCLDTMQDVVSSYPTAQLILRPNRALAAEFGDEGELLH